MAEEHGRGQAAATSPSNSSQQDLSLKSLRVWPSSPLNLQNVCLPTSRPTWKIPQFSCEKINQEFSGFRELVLPAPLPSTFYTGLNFPCFVEELSPVHEHTARVINIKNKIFFHFSPAAQLWYRQQNQAGVQFCMDHLSSVGSPWVGCAGLGGACIAEAEEMLLCTLKPGGRFMARSQRQHSCLGHSGRAVVGPNRRSPGRRGVCVLGGRAAAAVFGFPLVPGIEIKGLLLSIGEIGGGRGL